MKIGAKLAKNNSQVQKSEELLKEETQVVEFLDVKKWSVPEGYAQVDYYPLKPPFSYAAIVQNEETLEYLYVLDELPLNKQEREAYFRLRNISEYELQAPEGDELLSESFRRQMPIIMDRHPKDFAGISQVGMRKVFQALEKDIVGYGKIDPLMYDEYVEDIGCGGVNKPLFLWHRKYENIKTNVIFRDEQELDDFIMRVVHKAGKHVSIAFPIVDVTLPEKHRLAVSFGKETTPLGTSFTIRKFRKGEDIPVRRRIEIPLFFSISDEEFSCVLHQSTIPRSLICLFPRGRLRGCSLARSQPEMNPPH